jgi:hypothetical protein
MGDQLFRDYWSASVGMRFPGNDPGELARIADYIVKAPSTPQSFLPSGYGVKSGERVLLAINTFYDRELVDAVAQAIVRAGAAVDIVCIDMGEERELTETDEFKGFIHNWNGITEKNEIRNWSTRKSWVEKAAAEEGYDLLIHGTGQPPVKNVYRSDTIPWTAGEVFPSAAFPREVWYLD